MLDKQLKSLSSNNSRTEIARLSILPSRAELFLERFVNLDSGNQRRTNAFLQTFADLLCVPPGRPLTGFPSDTQLKLQKIWKEPSPLMKEAQLMLLAGEEQRLEVELARWERKVQLMLLAREEQRSEVELARWEGNEVQLSPLLGVFLYALKHANLLRYCANPACKEPYFVAQRGSQIYCGSVCAQPAQREAKLKWWHEHGAERRRKSSGKNRGRNAKTT